MELIADGLLIAGALAAALYCWVLSRRVSALQNMDSGVGGAIAELSRQIAEIRATLGDAKSSTDEAARALAERTSEAQRAAARLERLLTIEDGREAERRASPRRPAPSRQDLRAVPAAVVPAGADAMEVTAAVEPPSAPPDTPSGRDSASPPEFGSEVDEREDVLMTLRNIVQGMRS